MSNTAERHELNARLIAQTILDGRQTWHREGLDDDIASYLYYTMMRKVIEETKFRFTAVKIMVLQTLDEQINIAIERSVGNDILSAFRSMHEEQGQVW